MWASVAFRALRIIRLLHKLFGYKFNGGGHHVFHAPVGEVHVAKIIGVEDIIKPQCQVRAVAIGVIGKANLAANSSKAVWADTGYRSAKNEAWLTSQGYRSHVHRKKPRDKPMAKHIRRGNATRAAIRACVEHVLGHEKGPMALTIRSIGQARAAGRMTMANLSYNFRRLIFHERRQAIA